MKYIKDLHEGETIRSIYLCKGKRSAETRNGKPYDNLLLQDKTGTLDGKIWDPNSQGIADYDEKDFIEVVGDVITYNNNLQLNIKQLRIASEGDCMKSFLLISEGYPTSISAAQWNIIL